MDLVLRVFVRGNSASRRSIHRSRLFKNLSIAKIRIMMVSLSLSRNKPDSLSDSVCERGSVHRGKSLEGCLFEFLSWISHFSSVTSEQHVLGGLDWLCKKQHGEAELFLVLRWQWMTVVISRQFRYGREGRKLRFCGVDLKLFFLKNCFVFD